MNEKIDLVKVFELALEDRINNKCHISSSVSGTFFHIDIDNRIPLVLNYAHNLGKCFLAITGQYSQNIDKDAASKLVRLFDGIDNKKEYNFNESLIEIFGEQILINNENENENTNS